MTFRKVSQSLLDIDPNSLGGGSVEAEPLQFQRHSFVTNGTDDTYTAPFTLEGVGLLVFAGSTYQPESTYTVEGSDITFVEVPDEGIAIELVIGDGFGSKVNIPAELGVPYPTNETFDGRTVWAVRIDLGLTGAATVYKSTALPAATTNEWDIGLAYTPRIDISNCFVIFPGSAVAPLPNSSSVLGENIRMDLSYTGLVRTRVGASSWSGLPHGCVIKYLKQEP